MPATTSSSVLTPGSSIVEKDTLAIQGWYNSSTTIDTALGDANRTGNGTGVDQEPPEIVQLAAYFVPIFFGAIICIGLTGNSLVITVMTKLYKLHGQRLNNTNRFILNLAISDLLFLIFCVPFHAVVYTLEGWVFGGFFCVFSKYCEEMTKIASVYTLVALSVDRFLAVVYATSARQIRTKANAIRGLIFIWTAAASIAVPVVFTRTYMEFRGTMLCLSNSISWSRWYELSLTVFGYILPLSVIICCYVGLLRVMCITAKNSSITVSNSSSDSRKKVTRIVILVVIVFAICWMPHHIIGLWMKFDPNFDFGSKFTLAFRIVAHCMAYANSSLNPLIYAFVSKKFRQDFKKAFTCQYLTEAVGSVKEFSRRMIGTVRDSLSGSSGSRNNYADVRNSKSSKSKGGASKAIQKNQKFCPRSPLTPLGSIPRGVTEVDTTFVLVDMKSSPDSRRSPQVTSLRNSEQDLLLDESGCLFDDGSAYQRDQV